MMGNALPPYMQNELFYSRAFILNLKGLVRLPPLALDRFAITLWIVLLEFTFLFYAKQADEEHREEFEADNVFWSTLESMTEQLRDYCGFEFHSGNPRQDFARLCRASKEKLAEWWKPYEILYGPAIELTEDIPANAPTPRTSLHGIMTDDELLNEEKEGDK